MALLFVMSPKGRRILIRHNKKNTLCHDQHVQSASYQYQPV